MTALVVLVTDEEMRWLSYVARHGISVLLELVLILRERGVGRG